MKQVLKKWLLSDNGGTQVQRPDPSTMDQALARMKALGVMPRVVVDIGAAMGSWTMGALRFWPESDYYLVEPLDEQINKVPARLRENPRIHLVQAVAGAEAGTVKLHVTPDLDGSGIYETGGSEEREVKVLPVDEIIAPDKRKDVLLKLDTHGFELPILEGAKETLTGCCGVIIEVYGFYVSPTAKLFHEVTQAMHDRGFRLFDIVDVLRREKDNAFWQADAVYLRQDHPVFSNNSYT
ncbi:MAG: FkbM family methyltransferase [Flavobacteriales bacterium]|nr:FkbM family methyltransferase [Flavobacteriales bacterium]